MALAAGSAQPTGRSSGHHVIPYAWEKDPRRRSRNFYKPREPDVNTPENAEEEDFSSFLSLVAEGRIRERNARAAIKSAELSIFLDLDRLPRWQPMNDEDQGDVSGEVPRSSMLCGSMKAIGRTFGFNPRSFTLLLRYLYEGLTPFGMSRRT